jgi:hypothetical protein
LPVNVAIVGPAGAGKTTLFNALTAGRGADGVGMVDVPDERLTRLAEAVKPVKTTAAQVRVEDTPPGSRAQRVAFARQSDVLVKVARCFGPEPDPAAELEEFALDLVLADLASVEKRLDVVAKEARAGKKDAQNEHDVLTLAKAHLDAGRQLRTLDLEPDQRVLLMGIFPVTLKPEVYVANAADELLPGGGEAAAKVAKLAAAEGAPVIVLSARLESELGELDPAEQAEMRAGYGIDESGLGDLGRRAGRRRLDGRAAGSWKAEGGGSGIQGPGRRRGLLPGRALGGAHHCPRKNCSHSLYARKTSRAPRTKSKNHFMGGLTRARRGDLRRTFEPSQFEYARPAIQQLPCLGPRGGFGGCARPQRLSPGPDGGDHHARAA